MKKRDKIKILLIQIRTDGMKKHEYDCFREYMGLDERQLVSLDALTEAISNDSTAGYDAVIVGGSGEFSSVDNTIPEITARIELLIQYCYNNDFPFLGACYGAHLSVTALGGTMVNDPRQKEVGSFLISLTNAALTDPLFKNVSKNFWAQEGHKDSINKMPTHATLLATSQRCQIQAFTFKDKPFYAAQFHTELDKNELIERVRYYQGYVKDKAELESIIEQSQDSPEAAHIASLFVDNVVCPQS